MKKKKLRCYIYVRVSTSMQVDGYSLEAQRTIAKVCRISGDGSCQRIL